MIGSLLSSKEGNRIGHSGEIAFCKHYMDFPITSWDCAAIPNIKKSLAGSIKRGFQERFQHRVSVHDTYFLCSETFRQDRSLKELTGYEWNLLADSAAFSKVIREYVYGVTLLVGRVDKVARL